MKRSFYSREHTMPGLKMALLIAIIFMCKHISFAQNVNVSGAIVGNGLYANLNAAFTAINAGAQPGANIVISIIGNTVEPTTATLNQNTWLAVTIAPAGGAARTITGSVAGPLIDFNGADRVLINGVNSGGNSLTIENTNTGTASTIRYINDSEVNAVQNCTILGANTSTTSGTIFISTSAGIGGNDSIGFSTCTIDASGANFPVNGIYSAGTAGQENNHITISNCNIPNYFNASSVSCGVLAAAANTDWTITGCRFYQGATRTYTTGNTHRAIQISSGNNHSVLNNIIGFATSGGTGTYTMTGTIATRFIGIDLAVGTTTATSVQGNTIASINLGTSSGAATANGILCGINMTSGNINVGTITPNVIGSAAATGSLVGTPTTTQGAVVGINSSSTGVISIQNNIIGGLQSAGVTAAVAGAVFGINISGVTNSMTISGNTIGNTIPNNMVAGVLGVTTGSSLGAGINASSSAVNLLVSNNTIQNFSSYGTGTTGYVRGFFTATTGSSNSTISGNTVRFMTTSSSLTGYTSGNVSAAGIHLASGMNATISGNTIHGVSNINTGTTNIVVAGIAMAQATNTSTFNNVIYDLSNAGTGTTATAPPVVTGILIRSGTTAANVHNNMISIGTGQTTNTAFVGIFANHGSTPDPIDNIYYNTVNVTGTATAGALSSFCFQRGTFTTSPTVTVNIRNNIFTNTRTGGTGSHFAISNNFGGTSSATGWAAGNTNNNVLNAAASTVGYWTSALTFGNWQTTSSCDAASYSGITVTYINAASDLHLNMGLTPTPIESGGQTIGSITTDIDGQTRPGPAGSVNGGATSPDIGADETDAVPGVPPTITYTPLTFTCLTGDRTLTSTITDIEGVPTAGALQPRIYFRKNAGSWFSNQGTLTAGTATNGTWDFSITAATMGGLVVGDMVSYYVIAQDIASTPNIGASPGAGLVATDVNNVTTPPTTPNTYAISGTLSGTYNVGAGQTYTTLTQAVNAYNTSCLGGPITFLLTDLNYSAGETFPISINVNPDASAVNTLTIKPANTGTIITGSSTSSILRLNGADYITIDGSIGSTVNSSCPPVVSASRDLTISNTSTASSTAVIWLSSLGASAGATNNTIKNCIMNNGVDQSTTATENFCIVSCGSTIVGLPPPDGVGNDANLIENNEITRSAWGIFFRGGASSSNNGNIIRQNLVGPSAFGSTQIRRGGIILQHQDSATVNANEVRFVGNQISQSVGGTDHIGIGLGGENGPTPTATNITNTTVSKNTVHDIVCEKTFAAIGISIATPNGTATNNIIANNFIYNVRANGTASDQGIGINASSGNGDQIVYNTIYMVTADRDPAGSTTATESDMGVRLQAAAVNTIFEDNIIYVDEASNTSTLVNFSVVAPSAAYVWGISNYNDYAINTSNTQNVLFGLGNTGGAIPQVTTLAAWQTTFTPNQDANSLNIVPVFTSATDLHLLVGSNPGLIGTGTPIPGITDDIDCELRSLIAPDMGADENCELANTPTVSTSIDTICSGDSTILSITVGSLNESAMWQWYNGSCGGSPVDTGTSIVVNPSVTTDYFVRGEGGCPSPGACATITITVNALPLVVATTSNNPICAGDSVTLTGSGALSYSWNNGVTDAVGFIPGGTLSYIVTGTDTNACSNNDTITVTVNPLPVVGYIASPDDTVCFGTNLTLNGTGAASYVWSGGITDGVAFSAVSSQTYTVTGTDVNGCSNTTTAPIVVNSLPTVNLGADIVQANPPALLDAGAGFSSYFWNDGSTTQTINATTNGIYFVTVTDANGCTDSDTIMVNFTSGVFNPDGFPATILLYPNPSDGILHLNINGLETENLVIDLMDMKGSIISNWKPGMVEGTFNEIFHLEQLRAGMYMMRITANGNSAMLRFIKK